MHLDPEQIQRVVHSELAPETATAVHEHLAGCAECRAQVAVSEREALDIHALLLCLDHAPPRLDARDVVWRARTRRRDSQLVRWAAGIALALGISGASYAIPGSPVQAWVKVAARWIEGKIGHPAGRATAPAAPVLDSERTHAPDSNVAGIAVAPGDGLAITFTSNHGLARLSLTAGTEVVVRAPAGAATFTSRVDLLVIDNRDSSATFEIEIPRTAPRVEIRVGKQRIFLKEGPRLSTEEPAESHGTYLLRLDSLASRP